MTDKVLYDGVLDRIKKIHQLSQKFNSMLGKPHQERLLELMRKHIDEIEKLADYLVEVDVIALRLKGELITALLNFTKIQEVEHG